MGRKPGVGNKTPQELILEAEILKRKAQMQELDRQRKELAKKRQTGAKSGK